MASASEVRTNRLGVGQLLVRLLYQFRREVLAVAPEMGYGDIRAPHLQILANLGHKGARLTDLAARAQLSLAAASEFVTELEGLRYLERRPDPGDGRAKLIFPTMRGRQAFADGLARVVEIEQRWGAMVGRRRFQEACRVMQELVDHLGEPPPRGGPPN